MSVSITLMDGIDGETYTLNVTSEEATRIQSDMVFASEMLEESNRQATDQTNKDIVLFKWPHEAILLLVEEYRKMADKFSSGRISQKKTWQLISDELVEKSYNVTGPQCQSKFGGLKRTYKSIKDHNNKSGNGTRTWPYYDLLDSLLVAKPYITPIATVSSTGKRDQPELDSPSTSSTSIETPAISPGRGNPKKKLNYLSPVDKVLLAIEENRKDRKVAEEQRERRQGESGTEAGGS